LFQCMHLEKSGSKTEGEDAGDGTLGCSSARVLAGGGIAICTVLGS
jgi:hypothetical protein